MKVVIFATDRGVRLDAFPRSTACSFLPIRGIPVIEHTLNKLQLLKSAGEIMILTHPHFAARFREWLPGYHSRVPVRVIENSPCSFRDSRGALRAFSVLVEKENIREEVLALGADNIFSCALEALIACGRRHGDPVVGVYEMNGNLKPRQYGIVKYDDQRRITEFTEKPSYLNGSRTVSTCVYYFPAASLREISVYVRKNPEPETLGKYIEWLSREKTVRAFPLGGTWFDLGKPDAYEEAVFSF
ncbi:MAG: hypothetical protein GF333_00620 [Candidatus Omnitrophica bacterium]|nr:hypothetical protein [Candidatus Omnitrophota bacterium]